MQAKQAVTTRMHVVMADGSTRTVCCGPATLRMMCSGEAVGYRPTHDSRYGVCCHAEFARGA